MKSAETKSLEIKDIYPLSPMQEAMLFHSLHDQGDMYLEQMQISIEGTLDIGALGRSINALISKYDIFRTIFIYDKLNKPRQVVLKSRTLTLETVDVSECDVAARQSRIRSIAALERERTFDLSKDMLMRMMVVKTGETSFTLIWSYHHIMMDGWSLSIVMRK